MTRDIPKKNGDNVVQLPAELAERIDNRIADTGFQTRDEYAIEALDQMLTHIETGTNAPSQQTDEETEAVKDQLESLGYL